MAFQCLPCIGGIGKRPIRIECTGFAVFLRQSQIPGGVIRNRASIKGQAVELTEPLPQQGTEPSGIGQIVLMGAVLTGHGRCQQPILVQAFIGQNLRRQTLAVKIPGHSRFPGQGALGTALEIQASLPLQKPHPSLPGTAGVIHRAPGKEGMKPLEKL